MIFSFRKLKEFSFFFIRGNLYYYIKIVDIGLMKGGERMRKMPENPNSTRDQDQGQVDGGLVDSLRHRFFFILLDNVIENELIGNGGKIWFMCFGAHD